MSLLGQMLLEKTNIKLILWLVYLLQKLNMYTAKNF